VGQTIQRTQNLNCVDQLPDRYGGDHGSHSSIQTTERYLGSEQEIAIAVNDNLGL
jgi:hypothetical protein